MGKIIEVLAPVSGTIKKTSEVNDPVFAEEMMGPTIVITPNEEKVVSPITGKIITLFHTKHAYGIKHKKGPESLIHIGINTVQLKGEGFETNVEQDKKIKAGKDLGSFSISKIKESGKDVDTMVIFTDLADYKLNKKVTEGEVKAGQVIAELEI